MAAEAAAITAIASVVSASVGAAAAAGAFEDEPEAPVDTEGAERADARRRALAVAQKQRGRRATILTGGNTSKPDTSRPLLLGGQPMTGQPGGPQPAQGL